ncbi:hypothetical protein [Streptomyces nitrosporeus]|nr:hypothetical protein [Streptomyces nitrosporeus]
MASVALGRAEVERLLWEQDVRGDTVAVAVVVSRRVAGEHPRRR